MHMYLITVVAHPHFLPTCKFNNYFLTTRYSKTFGIKLFAVILADGCPALNTYTYVDIST